VVSVTVTGLLGHGLKPGRGDGFLRAIIIRSTPSFGWEVKPELSCRKILRHVKDSLTCQRYGICKILLASSIIPNFFFPGGGVGLVPKRGCLLTLAYYAFPR
jgi:hypothetical protein